MRSRSSDIPTPRHQFIWGYFPSRPSIVTRIRRDRRGRMFEIYEDRTRYPGHVLRAIRRDGKHR